MPVSVLRRACSHHYRIFKRAAILRLVIAWWIRSNVINWVSWARIHLGLILTERALSTRAWVCWTEIVCVCVCASQTNKPSLRVTFVIISTHLFFFCYLAANICVWRSLSLLPCLIAALFSLCLYLVHHANVNSGHERQLFIRGVGRHRIYILLLKEVKVLPFLCINLGTYI